MELNTSVWGEGVSMSGSGGNVRLASYNDSEATLNTLISNNKLTFNQEIDDSIYWCVNKLKSPLAEYSEHFLFKMNSKWMITENYLVDDGYQVNPLFIKGENRDPGNAIYNHAYGYTRVSSTDIGMGLDEKIQNNGSTIVTRIGRGKVILLAYVNYLTNAQYDINEDQWYFDSFGTKTVDEFINDQSLYEDPKVHITRIYFVVYNGSSYTSRSTIAISLNTNRVYKNLNALTNGLIDWADYSWGGSDTSWTWRQREVDCNDYFPSHTAFNTYADFQIGSRAIDINAIVQTYSNAAFIRCPCINSKWTPRIYVHRSTNHFYFATELHDRDEIMNQVHIIAHAGLFYTPKKSTAETTDLSIDEPTDENLYWGIVTNGYATGRYGQGGTGTKVSTTNPDLPDSTSPDTDPDFDGNENTDTNDYIDDTPLEAPKLSTVGVFNRTYAMTANQLMILADDLWNADLTKFEEIIEGLGLMGENPMNGLIDCRLYPFDITKLLPVFQSESIVLGRTVMQAMGYKLSNNLNAIIDLGECDFKPYFNKQYYSIDAPSYLDYSPYTEARLYIPYCGFVPIDTAEFMGHHITAKMVIDVVTGSCCAIVWKDGIIAIKANGIVGVSIPMTGTDSATYAMSVTQGLINGAVQIASGVGKIVAGGIGTQTAGTSLMKSSSGGVNAGGAYGNNSFSTSQFSRDTNSFGRRDILRDQGAAGQIINGAWQLHQAAATPVQYAQAGSASPSCETWLPQYPYFIVDRTVPEIPFNYGHTVGFACFVNEQLSMFSGFTICSNVDTSGFSQATESERAELKMLLESGVFLPVSN